MTNLATEISRAITKSLLAHLPDATSEHFDVNKDEFKEFLQKFLIDQFSKTTKSGRSPGPKGTNGKGRITGYILFSNKNRESVQKNNPDIKFVEVGKTLGKMWRDLSGDEQIVWNQKATRQNTANGLPTPSATPVAKGKANAVTKGKGKTPEKSVERRGKLWVISDTNFVLNSARDRLVIGKIWNDKVIKLSLGDIKACETKGWKIKMPEKKPPVKVKNEPTKTVHEEDESDDMDSDDE